MPDNQYQRLSPLSQSYVDKAKHSKPFYGQQLPVSINSPSHFGNFWNEAYNKSLIGVADEIWGHGEENIWGNKRDLSQLEYGTLFDVSTFIAAMAMDIPFFWAGGSLSKLTAQGAVKAVGKDRVRKAIGKTSKVLAANSAKPTYINKVRNSLNDTFLKNGKGLVFELGGMGMVSGLHDAGYQKVNKDDVDWQQAFHAYLMGAAALGLSKVGGIATGSVVSKTTPKPVRGGIKFGGEVLGFEAPHTFSEGRILPSLEDFQHSAMILGGAKMAFGGINQIANRQSKIIEETNKYWGNRDSIQYKDIPKKYRAEAERAEQMRRDSKEGDNRVAYFDSEGNLVFKVGESKGQIEFYEGEAKYKEGRREAIFDPKEGLIPSSRDIITKKISAEEFHTKYNTKPEGGTPRQSLLTSIKEDMKRIGLEKDIQSQRDILFEYRTNKPKGLGKKDTGIELLTNKELAKVQERLASRVIVKDAAHKMYIMDKMKSTESLASPFRFLSNVFDRLTMDGLTLKTGGGGLPFWKVHIPPFLRSWRTWESKVHREGVNPAAKALSEATNDYHVKQMEGMAKEIVMLEKAGILKEIGNKEQMELLQGELEKSHGMDPHLSNAAKILRLGYNRLYALQVNAGLKPEKYLENYGRRYLKPEIQAILSEFRDAVYLDKPALFEKIEGFKNDPATIKFVEKKMTEILSKHQNKNNGVHKALEILLKNNKNNHMDAFFQLERTLIQASAKDFHRMKRKFNIEWNDPIYKEIFETNATHSYLRYAVDVYEQLARKQYFGSKYEKSLDIIERVEKGEGEYKADRVLATDLSELMKRTIGAIESDINANMSPKAKKMFQSLNNLEIAAKIGLNPGATLVQGTQPFISSLFLQNYNIGIRSYLKRFVSKKRKNELRDMGLFEPEKSGIINTMEVFTGLRRTDATTSRALATVITELSQFQGMNRLNLQTSGSIAVDVIKDLNRIANGERLFVPKESLAGQTRQAWAKRKLFRDFGIVWKGNKKISHSEIVQGSIRFARDSQLQKNYLKENYITTTPKYRPWVLLKTFGFKQGKLVKDGMVREISDGNVLPAVRLSMGAGIMGSTLLATIEAVQNVLSGKDEYDWRRRDDFKKDPDETYAQHLVDLFTPNLEEFAAVGALGVASDFMSAENKMNQLGFTITPVVLSDVGTIWNGVKRLIDDEESFGLGGALRRSPKNFGRIFGSGVNYLSKRLETNTQKEGRIRNQKGRINKQIIENYYNEEYDEAKRKLRSWNKAHPDNPILEPDAEAIYMFILKKHEKKSKP